MSDLTEMVNPKLSSFTWGVFIKIHFISNFQIVEYEDNKGETWFHFFVDENDAHKDSPTLKEAIVSAIAYEEGGPNSQAAKFFFRMIKE